MTVVVQLAMSVGVKRPLVQILVVVANIQIITLNTEVDKGYTRTAIGCRLVYPNNRINTFQSGWFLDRPTY